MKDTEISSLNKLMQFVLFLGVVAFIAMVGIALIIPYTG